VGTNLHVRNVGEDLVAKLKRRAARNGRSAEAEHRDILPMTVSISRWRAGADCVRDRRPQAGRDRPRTSRRRLASALRGPRRVFGRLKRIAFRAFRLRR